MVYNPAQRNPSPRLDNAMVLARHYSRLFSVGDVGLEALSRGVLVYVEVCKFFAELSIESQTFVLSLMRKTREDMRRLGEESLLAHIERFVSGLESQVPVEGFTADELEEIATDAWRLADFASKLGVPTGKYMQAFGRLSELGMSFEPKPDVGLPL